MFHSRDEGGDDTELKDIGINILNCRCPAMGAEGRSGNYLSWKTRRRPAFKLCTFCILCKLFLILRVLVTKSYPHQNGINLRRKLNIAHLHSKKLKKHSKNKKNLVVAQIVG
jgi:hypothetical protein